jgi:hypothetical protein
MLLLSCSSTGTAQNSSGGGPSPTVSQVGPTADQGYKVPDTNKLAIEDIKKSYEGSQNTKLVNITEYNNFHTGYDYVLVEYLNDSENDCFDWYDLTTGDKDVLPLYAVHKAELIKINYENDLLFETDGISMINGHMSFPEVIRCCRGREITGYDGDFYPIEIDNYLEVSRGVAMGRRSKQANISDIKVSLSGAEVLFEAKEGIEDEFYTAYTTIPHTETSYIKEGNQFVIEFENTGISPKLTEKDLKKDMQNNYISSIEVKKDNQNCRLIINLKDTAKYYTAKEGDLEAMRDEFPYVAFGFTREFKVQW